MTALTSLLRLFLVVLAWPFRVAEHRRTLADLAAMDDHGLRDIGLTRQDLRDVTALPLGADPTGLLAVRADERARASLAAQAPPAPRPKRLPPPAWRTAAE